MQSSRRRLLIDYSAGDQRIFAIVIPTTWISTRGADPDCCFHVRLGGSHADRAPNPGHSHEVRGAYCLLRLRQASRNDSDARWSKALYRDCRPSWGGGGKKRGDFFLPPPSLQPH